jgi:hypothetical protein
MIHELKTIPPYFDDVLSGEKTFEVRRNDRPFNKGDLLALNEFIPETQCYTGRSCVVAIEYILGDPEYVKDNFVILGIKPCAVSRSSEGVFTRNDIFKVPLATKGDEDEQRETD